MTDLLYGPGAIICPRCGAGIGSSCRKASGHVTAYHATRRHAYNLALADQLKELHVATTPGSHRYTHRGVLTEAVWTCGHNHRSQRIALACARHHLKELGA